ncbi:outer membrane biogenesis protein BamB [Thalassoglobus neptunius]|uniref:Outer membrane biogenesis protein BamB n=1 Tax=Thalassoglobus neptunius TaxID=1938619 RepID=A0A5C5X8K3_9PLAN|nr:PQQ-binding-like beta-propeller repeat protein [Thalassoglobus neptunius]TWT58613.1 outer membrane biogenesis protein BamB [Thalassoglobus neptunius]
MYRALLLTLVVLCASTPLLAGDWLEFLGHGGTARSSDVVPVEWSESSNLIWNVDLPGTGSSSPIIVGDRVIVTCYVAGDGEARREVLCFDKNTGAKFWSVDFPIDYSEDPYQGYIIEHGYASNTPVSDGEHVFVFLGKGGVHAITLDGEKVWSVDVGKESSNRQWGSGASLLLFEDSLIVNAAEESKAILALNKSDGSELWRQEAGMLELAYGTPRLVTIASGEAELVISVPEEVWALNPSTGKLKWFAQSPMTGNVCPSIIVDGGEIYTFGGYRSSGSVSLNAGGKGDVTQSHSRWESRYSSYVATPLLYDGRLYWIDDQGIAYCTSAKDGSLIYRERVGDLGGGRPVYASPVLIGKYIYVVSRTGGTVVYPPGPEFEPIARNVISSDKTDFNASPAVADGRIYLRSNQVLYCIGEK